MVYRTLPLALGVVALGSLAQAGSLDQTQSEAQVYGGSTEYEQSQTRGYEQGTAWGFTYFGEAGYRYSGDAPSSGKLRGGVDFFSGQKGFGVTGSGQIELFDSKYWNSSHGSATIFGADLHAYYEFKEYFTVGAYYAYEGSNDIRDLHYYGGEAMVTYNQWDVEVKAGLADYPHDRGKAIGYELAGYYNIRNDFSVGAGYARIDDEDVPNLERAFARVSYGGLLPDNNIGVFGEVSYWDYDGAFGGDSDNDTSIAIGIEWALGRGAEVGRRPFRRPITYTQF